MLEGILIIFSREFSPQETFVNSILSRMNAHGRPYKEWMTPNTPVKVVVHSDAQDPTAFLAQAAVQFRRMGVPFSAEKIEYATFEGSHGISGTVVSQWS